jgi:hypothetical protein
MKRRKPIRAKSERRLAYEAELDAMTPLLEARSRGVCEICGFGVAIHRHHRLRRSQGGTNDLGNLLHLCRLCHDTVHAYPAASYDRGWLLRRPLDLSPYCA